MRILKSFLISIFLCFQLYADVELLPTNTTKDPDRRYVEYLKFLSDHPLLGNDGNADQGEIQIVKDAQMFPDIERATGRKIGVIARDRYWTWVNDPVKFPSGKFGVYGRMFWNSGLQGPAGAVVVPVLEDGRIVLNLNFRHATRSWEYELPRGVRDQGESPEQTAIREAREETGLEVSDLCYLGMTAADTGLTNTIAPIYLARVVASHQTQQEDTEAIEEIIALKPEEIREGFLKGYVEREIKGQRVKVYFRDSSLAAALYFMSIRN